MSAPNRTQMLLAGARYDTRRQRAVAISCAFVVLMMVAWTGMCAGLMSFAVFLADPALTMLSAVAAVVLAIPYALVILWIDRNEREPPLLLLSAFLWGAIVATMISFVGNVSFEVLANGFTGDEAIAGQLTASISAPFVEELSKGAAMVALYLMFRHHFDNVLDGVVYGALVGLGFAVFENFLYYVNQGEIGAAIQLICMRGVITSPGSHACFTAITGAGFGLLRVQRSGALRFLIPVLAVGLAMFVHFAWNTFTGFFLTDNLLANLVVGLPMAVIVIQLPFVLLVVLVSGLALWHESVIIRRYLQDEAGEVVRPGDLDALVPARRRTLKGLRLLLSFDFGGWNRFRKRCNALVELAFEKWHMDREAELGEAIAKLHAERVLALREQLTRMPASPA